MLAGATAFVAWLLPWRLVLSPSTPTGGDAHSHYAAFVYFLDQVLPQGRLWGWDPGALAGYPLFQVYFPLPFLAMAGLAQLTGPAAAFKLLSLAPALALPLCAFLCLRWLRLGFPGPGAGAVLCLCLLLEQVNQVWGGNLASLLAGEFCYGWGLCLALLYLGRLPGWIDGRRGLAGQVFLLVLVGLSHAYALIFCLAAGLYFLCEPGGWRRAGPRLLVLYGLGFMLLGFWLVPLLVYSPYSEVFGQVWVLRSWREYLPPLLLPGFILAAAGLLALPWLGGQGDRRRAAFLGFWLVCGLALFLAAPRLNAIDVRYGPFAQVAALLLAAQALALLARRLAGAEVLAVLVLAAGLLGPGLHTGYLPSWLRWNNSGLEAKQGWQHYQAVARFLRGGWSDPRVAWEHAPILRRLGSMRAWETLPLWSGRAVLEGLYMQASPNAPAIYYLQSLLSARASAPFPGYVYAHQDLTRAHRLLELFNVGQVILSEPATKARAQDLSGYVSQFQAGPYQVFGLEPPPAGYAVTPACRPVAVVSADPRVAAFEWLRFSDLRVPLVFLGRPPEAGDKRFAAVFKDGPDLWRRLRRGGLPCRKLRPDTLRVRLMPERIVISGLTPGRPLWVKVSWHPAWRSTSGETIFRASPGFMLVFPQGRSLTLVMGPAWPHWLGGGLSLLGLVLLALVAWKPGLVPAGEPGRPLEGRAGWLFWAGAAVCLLGLTALHQDGTTLRWRGHRLLQAGQAGRAAEVLQEAIAGAELQQDQPYACLDLAFCYARQGRHQQAVRVLRELLQRFPDSRAAPEAWFELGRALRRAGREQEAQRAWRTLLKRHPRTSWAWKALDEL